MKDVNISFNDIHKKILRIFETIYDKIRFKHLESRTRNEDNSTDIQKIPLVMKTFMTIGHHQTY